MSDKKLIKQEIERLKNHTLNIQKSEDGFVTSVERGRVEAFNDVLKFIDSLPEEPKFKVGDKIVEDNESGMIGGEIIDIDYTHYELDEGRTYIPISHQYGFKLVEESVSEDLEKEIDEEIDNLCELGCYMEDLVKGNSEGVYPLPDNVVKELRKFARHFAEWQKQQDKKLFKDDSWNYIEENYPNICQEEKLRLYDISIKSRLAGANSIKQQMKKTAKKETTKAEYDKIKELALEMGEEGSFGYSHAFSILNKLNEWQKQQMIKNT